MAYLSTRGEAPEISFTEALLAGLAPDGGLYVPHKMPRLSRDAIAGFAGKPYVEVAEAVISPFLDGALGREDFRAMLEAAYETFRHKAVTPLAQIGDNLFVLELFHGPTLAFKDVAMQLLGRLMDRALKARNKRATIVGATSGDTGAAAIEAFRGLDQVDVFILYPHGRVSDVQRRQMTTVAAGNIHAIALEGTFDDAQAMLKSFFRDKPLREELGLSGVNSINFARVVAQMVYYFTSAAVLGGPLRKVSFTVPTGNFGDILAGFMAKQMGLPVEKLIVATNSNDILARALATGRYEVRGVHATQSPSMDIQVSSNFERLLFDALDRDPAAVRALMARLDQSGAFDIPRHALEKIRADFAAGSTDEAETSAEIGRVWRECEVLLDPHTAVAVHVARKNLAHDPATPMVALGTAHPAKFPDAVRAATGRSAPLPAHLADLFERKERFDVLPNDAGAVASFIRARARAVTEKHDG
ncbi:threonine synthase [Rhodoblastus acidophilus]|uniref:Threonine synthase n=1 Tax=Candidatus Rhodoblastus alkanivorans TaxID=2954117 RepID=A0ABS9ZAQ0_9HYPH|nr:threonine synthase [Candidatus Rhodoblastus alkanivorans]MCI4684724.1 threonine synthase [Candidatus Rhodoblastus alkanivorans]MDI4642046.1 threonine synthase [Rhodoblastus acidophilus]